MTPLDHALEYARRGLRVAPVAPGTKWPRLDAWQDQATTDEATIRSWWAHWPDSGVSIVTGVASGIFVVDVDPGHGGDDTLADLEHEHGALPETAEVITGNAGRHLYFRMPDGVVIVNSAGSALGPGLDVRGEGGQVVAPPTIHPNGQPYAWEAEHDLLDGVAIAEPPAWLVEMLTVEAAPREPRRERVAARGGIRLSELEPGEVFAAEHTWPELLEADGWRLHSARLEHRSGAGYELWTRPGKETRDGASASLYYGGSDVLKVFTENPPPGLRAGETYTRFGYYAATRHGGDHSAAARALRREMNAAGVSSSVAVSGSARSDEATSSASESERPSIVCNGRHLDDVATEALDALAGANDPPRLFVRSGEIARVRDDEEGRPIVEQITPKSLRGHMAESARWWRALKDGGLTAVSPPGDVVDTVISAGSWPLPPLAGIVELPVVRADGTFAVEHGYDAATKLYHWHRGPAYAPVPERPTPAELAAAVALVSDALCDFPWDTSADRANAWALLLTPLVRPLVGQVPMALVDAPEPGTGKGLLVTVAATLALGRPAGLTAWPSTEEEVAKVITSTLMAGSTMVIFDNVEGMIRSGNLAAALTADVWSGRILGVSRNATVSNRATWVATGNNIDVGGDLARRCYRIRLDARQAQPWKRTGFRHPDLASWVAANRVDLLHALCVIVRSWWAAGRQEAAGIPAMGGYTPWVRIVGGILAHAGIGDFLGNLAAFHATADRESQAWEAFLTAWAEEIGEQSVTVAELIARMKDLYAGHALRDVLPDDLSGHFDKPGFPKRLGWALRHRTGRHYGDAGLHIIEMPRDRRQVSIYAVSARVSRLMEEETRAETRGPLSQVSVQSAGFAGFTPIQRDEKKLSTCSARADEGAQNPQTRETRAEPAPMDVELW